TAKVVVGLSDKVNRTEYPDINKIILAAKEKTGDPDVIRYGLSMETFIKNYAAATGQGNSVLTDHQYDSMRRRLNEAHSKGQVRAEVDQALIEINRELKGTHNASRIYLGRKEGEEPAGFVSEEKKEKSAPVKSKPKEGEKRKFDEGPATFRNGRWILDER